jgi:hypothetical protein
VVFGEFAKVSGQFSSYFGAVFPGKIVQIPQTVAKILKPHCTKRAFSRACIPFVSCIKSSRPTFVIILLSLSTHLDGSLDAVRAGAIKASPAPVATLSM